MKKIQNFWFIPLITSLFFTQSLLAQARNNEHSTKLHASKDNSLKLAQIVHGTNVYGTYITVVRLYRYWNGFNHFYTTDPNEIGSGRNGYKIEFQGGAEIANQHYTGTVPLYRYYNGSDHFYTTNYNELGAGRNGYVLERIEGYIYPTDPFKVPAQRNPAVVPLYRYYNGSDHFYTTDYSELGSGRNGYVLEKIEGYVLQAGFTQPRPGLNAVEITGNKISAVR